MRNQGERDEVVMELVFAALEQAPETRESYLRSTCGYDSDLRSQLQEIQDKLGLAAQRIDPKSVDDIYKPVLGSMHLSCQNLI